MAEPPPVDHHKTRLELSELSAEPTLSLEGSQDTSEPFKRQYKRQLDMAGSQDCADDSQAKKHKLAGPQHLEVGIYLGGDLCVGQYAVNVNLETSTNRVHLQHLLSPLHFSWFLCTYSR